MVIMALIIPLNKPLLMPVRLKNELAPLLRSYDATLTGHNDHLRASLAVAALLKYSTVISNHTKVVCREPNWPLSKLAASVLHD
jgi:hypothetical protein